MRKLILFLVLATAVILEIGVLDRYFGQYYLSLVVPLTLVMIPYFSLEEMLVAAAIAGLVLDSATLSRSILSTVILVCEVLIIRFLGRRYLNFSANLPLVIAAVFFALLSTISKILISGILEFSVVFFEAIAVNLIISILIILIFQLLFGNNHAKTDRKV